MKAARTNVLAPCGTRYAYRRHLRRGEATCAACRAAEAAHQAARRARKQQQEEQ